MENFKAMQDYTELHKVNIWIHVAAGVIAIIMGLCALLSNKAGKFHQKSGRVFLIFLSIVIITGLLGFIFFKVNMFLFVLTLLSGYNGYSGFQIIKTKSNIPRPKDILIALVTLSSGIYFLYFIQSFGMIWSPIIIYSTLGFLFFTIAYDFLRYIIPLNRYRKLWLYEHIYKMIAAFTALLAAATGTILPDYHPYSQFLPSVFGTLLAIAMVIYYGKKRIPENKRQS